MIFTLSGLSGVYPLTLFLPLQVRRVKATPAPKQFIDEQGAQAARQANLKVGMMMGKRGNNTINNGVKLDLLPPTQILDDFTASPGEAAAAESAGGAPEAAAQRAAATAATAETTADQLQTTAASAAPVSE